MNSSRFDSVLRQVLIVPTVAILLGAGVLYVELRAANRTVTHIQSADQAIAETIEIERLMDDEETGLRGYQTTGDPVFLEPYHAAELELAPAFDRLRDAARPPAQTAQASPPASDDAAARIDAAESACDDWNERFAEPVIASIQAGGRTSDDRLNLRGKAMFDQMRQRITELNHSLAALRDAKIASWQRQTALVSVALLVLAAALGLVLGLYMRRLLKEVSAAFHRSADALRMRTEQIFRSEQKLRTTLESIGDGVITCDADGRVESMNVVAQELTGWPLPEALGKEISTVFPIVNEDTREPVENPVAKVKRLNRVVGLANHTLLKQRGGTEIAIDDSGAPIRDEHGALTGIVMVFRDISSARRAQATLLTQEKLATAGRLAATIAHEIHNPLDSVSNLLFLMDGQSTPEETTHFLALARQEIARVTQISRAMLSLYRESRAPVLVDIAEMLNSILLLMERRLADLGVEMHTEFTPGLTVQGFPAELRQVFTNLITNAAEACSPYGEAFQAWQAAHPELYHGELDQPPLIIVRTQPCPAGLDVNGLRREAGVMVSILDEGPGIPENVAERLFQPFFTTKGERGTGLGLWVSRGIMTKHGGSVDFTTSTASEDHGTTFSVFVPSTPAVVSSGG